LLYDPSSKGALAYAQLAKELIARVAAYATRPELAAEAPRDSAAVVEGAAASAPVAASSAARADAAATGANAGSHAGDKKEFEVS
jgi:hypothetical protein